MKKNSNKWEGNIAQGNRLFDEYFENKISKQKSDWTN
jgi:hypothetical protein